jgi:EF-P beta-lysylation protein EpmB
MTVLEFRQERAAGAAPWQQALREAVHDPAELLRLLALDAVLLPAAQRAAAAFPLRVPRGFVARMRRGDPADPLLRQVLPLDAELAPAPGYGSDPVGELAAMTVPGLLHKYRGRALLVTTGACAVHCRYCFRRHFPYGEANPAPGQWERALDYLAGDPTLTEVILSGGDPLVLPDERLAGLARALERIPHLRRLRVHTRLPVVLPERVDGPLLDWLCGTRLQPVVVIHANHAAELDDAVRAALHALRARGVSLLNQAVLLRGVNDSVAAQAALSEALFAAGVLPYYLHALDPVAGAAHFAVPDAVARTLHAALRTRLPGYLVPRLVREVPGAPAKLPL